MKKIISFLLLGSIAFASPPSSPIKNTQKSENVKSKSELISKIDKDNIIFEFYEDDSYVTNKNDFPIVIELLICTPDFAQRSINVIIVKSNEKMLLPKRYKVYSTIFGAESYFKIYDRLNGCIISIIKAWNLEEIKND